MRSRYKQIRFYLNRKVDCIKIRKKSYDRSINCRNIQLTFER